MATCFLVVLILVAVTWVWLAVSPAHRVTFRDVVGASGDVGPEPGRLPPVTVVVPARNEAAMLPGMVPTWCRQDYPDLRVVVVDDQSDDGSGELLEGLRVTFPNLVVVSGTDRPAGWCGKPWAVVQGVGAVPPRADDELLLLTDADCALHPACTRQAVKYLLGRGLDLFSLLPRITFGGTLERVGVTGLVTALGMLFPIGWANDPRRKLALAAGGFILVRRGAYERLGGHACVKSHLIEDVHLARKFKAAGMKVEARLTPDLVTTRMYDGPRDLWEGLTKNAYAGMEYQPHKFWAGLVAGLLITVLPPIYLLASAVWVWSSPSPRGWAALGLSLLINLLVAAVHWRAVRHLRLPLIYVLLMPASAALYIAAATSSAWQHHFGGGNLWKGRRYDRKLLLTAMKGDERGRPTTSAP